MSEDAEGKSRLRKHCTGAGISVGAAIGVALGEVYDHLALGLALGGAFGSAVDVVSHFVHKNTNKPR
jgi:hypothetical protein